MLHIIFLTDNLGILVKQNNYTEIINCEGEWEKSCTPEHRITELQHLLLIAHDVNFEILRDY